MENSIVKNDKQIFFNQVRGEIEEMNDGDEFCNITLKVGHENNRFVNFVTKKAQYIDFASAFNIGDKVMIKFYASSRKKFDRWYTTLSILDIVRS